MENAEEVFHFLEDFSKRKPKTIPKELNDYLAYVARTGDPVYQWSQVKCLFKEKLLNVITDFYETTPGIDIPPYPNVDPFNYDIMKNSLLERLDSFTAAPFTVQRICELLTCPRKQYNRVDKFMRAIEKNILVVSTREPGSQRHIEAENGEPMEAIVNGSDNNSDYNVDVEMEDLSWKEGEQQNNEPQPGSSESQISVDDIEARLKAKQDASVGTHEKVTTQYESVTPPELNVTSDDSTPDTKPSEESNEQATTSVSEDNNKPEPETETAAEPSDPKPHVEVTIEPAQPSEPLVIPEIKVDDVEMTEQRLSKQSSKDDVKENEPIESEKQSSPVENKPAEVPQTSADESSTDSTKEEVETKHISEVSTSSEESSSSSDNTDGNSNSPKTDIEEGSSQPEELKSEPEAPEPTPADTESPKDVMQSDNYSISDVNSELPQPQDDKIDEKPESQPEDEKEEKPSDEQKTDNETKAENIEMTEESKES